jgi:tetratricopeptide (TPR) repeat protein
VITIAPATLVPLNVLVNEHRMYLPLVGAAVLVARIWPSLRRGYLVGAAVLLAALTALTVERNRAWHDELSLWRDSAEKSPYMSRSHVHFGNALRDRGRSEEAEMSYERALQLEPAHRSAQVNVANLYYERGWRAAADSSLARRFFLTAAAAFERAITAHPLFGEAYYNLGHLHVGQENPTAAVAPLERALTLHIDSQSSWSRGDALWDLGNAYAGSNRLPEAVHAYRRARALNGGGSPRYVRNLGEVLFAMGERALAVGDSSAARRHWEEAEICYRELIALGSDEQRAVYRLGQMEKRLQ